MGAVVPSQFLFTADPSAGVILGFKINSDGGLSPVPGSPFVAPNSPTLLVANGKDLFAADEAGLTAFAVNRETGTINKLDSVAMPPITNLTVDSSDQTVFATSGTRRTEVRVVNSKLQLGEVSGIMLLRPGASSAGGEESAGPQVRDASGQFSYALNSSTGEISAFRVEGSSLVPLSPATYPAGHAAVSLAIARP
jgi:6-phosphogluconolactonase (cycloisomerase 2 family)